MQSHPSNQTENGWPHLFNQTDNMNIHIPKSMDSHIPPTLVLEPNTPIENELGEIVITGEPEFEEIVEEYEEEILV